MEGRRRRRFPSKEELELWAKVTRHDEPMARTRPAARQITEPPVAGAPRPALEKPARPRSTAMQPEGRPGLPAKNKLSSAPPPEPFDARAAKRIARGHREIEARLDLHGLRQQDAHAVLRRFLARCQADGLRHVLIITGKGRSDRGEERDFWTAEERGVLRRLVPHWLCEPAMRLHVVSFTESAMKHGGSGALYVTIRKARSRI